MIIHIIKNMLTLKVKQLSGWDKVSGLLFAKKAYPVLLKTRFGIHTFGMKFPIDVLALDNNLKVVKIVENLQPNRIFLWNPIYDIVIELPSGEVKKQKIKLGQRIKLKLI